MNRRNRIGMRPVGVIRNLWLCALLLAGGCAGSQASGVGSAKATPDWVRTGMPSGIDTYRHMAGIGCGPTRTTADGLARSEIARQIEVQVADTTVLDREHRVVGNRTDFRETLASRTRQTTQVTLSATEIRERHSDGRQVCSLAVLDRASAVAAARQDVATLAPELAQATESARQARDAIEAIEGWKVALERLIRVDAMQRLLCVLAAQCDPISPVSVSAVHQNLAQARNSLAVRIRIDGNNGSDRILGSGLADALARSGIQTTQRNDAALEIRGRVRLAPGNRTDPRLVFRALQADLALVRVTGDTVLSFRTWSDEAGHVSVATADDILMADLLARGVRDFAADVERIWLGFQSDDLSVP